MGTYTTNKNLFMPTVGETGWGTLVNTNFSTIDTYLKPISLSGSTYTFTGKHVGNQSGGSISATTGTFSGAVTAKSFNGVILKNSAYTITPTNTTLINDMANSGMGNVNIATPILPFNVYGYTGSIKFTNTSSSSNLVNYYTDKIEALNSTASISVPANGTYSLTFTNIHFLKVACGTVGLNINGFTIS